MSRLYISANDAFHLKRFCKGGLLKFIGFISHIFERGGPVKEKNRFVRSHSRQGLFLFFVLPPVWELVTARNFLFMQGTTLDMRHRSVAHRRAVVFNQTLEKANQEQIKH